MRPRITFWFLLVLIIILLILQRYLHDIVFIRSIYFIIFLIIISFVITKNSINGFYIERKSREDRQQVGKNFKEFFTIENRSKWIKFWISIIDKSNIGVSDETKIISWLLPKSKNGFGVQTLLNKRGMFTLGPTQICSGDPFGIFSNQRTFISDRTLLVIPSYETIPFFPTPEGYLYGGRTKNTRLLEVSPYVFSVREYAPGDSLRRIDWKSTAKLNKLMVKELEQDPQSNVWLIIDGEKENHYFLSNNKKPENEIFENLLSTSDLSSALQNDTFEHIVSYAASIANYYLTRGKALGLSSNAQEILQLSPEKGERQLSKVLEMLALLRAESEMPISEFIESQTNKIKKGNTVVIISSTESTEILPPILRLKKMGIFLHYVSVNSELFGSGKNNHELVNKLLDSGIYTISMEINDNLSSKIPKILTSVA